LKPLDEAAIVTILRKAMTDVEHGLAARIQRPTMTRAPSLASRTAMPARR
jgi:hypothetical protein